MAHDHKHCDHDHAAHHDHDHEHARSHGHHVHAPAGYGRAFAVGIILNTAFVGLEVVYGVMANSMALVADAGHNLSDVLALGLAWLASVLAQRRPAGRFTYGLRSSSILGALANAMLLLVVSGAILWEAILRLFRPETVASETVIWVAAAGILVNTATALMFMKGRERDLNIRGAFLHMAADALVSAGVALAGLGIMLTGWAWLDPVVSLLIIGAILWSTWGLLADAVSLSLHAVPPGIDFGAIRAYLESLPDVAEVHDLHIWGMSTTETALTAHLVTTADGGADAVVAQAVHELNERFHIGHATLQVERVADNYCCPLAPAHVV